MFSQRTESTTSSQCSQKYSIFNGQYEILDKLGQGRTSKVYLGRDIEDPKNLVALKFIRNEVLSKDETALKSLKQEIQILHGLKHPNINSFIDYGSDGKIVKPSGRVIPNLIYIILEYVPCGIFYDLCQAAGGLGEQGGRYFMDQLLDAVSYMHSKHVVHRDLKPENILVGDNLNLVVADFGYATYKKINKLQEYCGTKVYMAPEITEQKPYDGRKSDIFSLGVILFVIVLCKFPFSKAEKDEYYYKLILDGKLDEYWNLTGGIQISKDFKDLTMKMLSYDPADRPTIEEIKDHPWMRKLNKNKAENEIMRKLRGNDSYKIDFNLKPATPKQKKSIPPAIAEQNTRSQKRLNTAISRKVIDTI